MKKNKRVLCLVLAFMMIFGGFSNVSFVHAEETGISLSGEEIYSNVTEEKTESASIVENSYSEEKTESASIVENSYSEEKTESASIVEK